MTDLADAYFECVTTGYYLEGLLVDGENIWYTDIAIGGVHLVGSSDILLADRAMIGGLLLNRDGALLVSGLGGIVWVNPRGGNSGPLVEGLGGVNEMCSDGKGGAYFGTTDLPAILQGRRPDSSTIQHLTKHRQLREVREGLTFANGIALSNDGKTLFFNESFSACKAFPVSESGTLSEPRIIAEMPDCDGMALDEEGNVWLAGFKSGELRCVRPDGTEKRRLSLPGGACTNVCFGGADRRDLYVTVVDPASVQALAEGRQLAARNSMLYRTRSPVAGAKVECTDFVLT